MKKGFTLIELLVVVLIIGILSAIALPQYQKTVWKSRAAGVWPVLKALEQAKDAYCLANSDAYTSSISLTSLDVEAKSDKWFGSYEVYYKTTTGKYSGDSTARCQDTVVRVGPSWNTYQSGYGSITLALHNGKRYCGTTDATKGVEFCKMLGMPNAVLSSDGDLNAWSNILSANGTSTIFSD